MRLFQKLKLRRLQIPDGVMRKRIYRKFFKTVQNSIKNQLSAGVSRGAIYESLWEMSKGGMELEEILAIHEAQSIIEDILVDRNIEGRRLEKKGKVDEAIAIYEANVKDCFDGSHPYERLRVIYSGRHMYREALRVCERFLCITKSSDNKDLYGRHIAKLNDILAQEGS